MNKSTLFLLILFVGLIGKWIFTPTIKKLHQQREYQSQLKKQQETKLDNCLESLDCSLYDLAGSQYLHGKNRLQARSYLIKNWSKLSRSNQNLSWKLRGAYSSQAELEESFIRELLKNDPMITNLYLTGLYQCHEQVCRDIFERHQKYFAGVEFRLNYLKLKLKSPGSWSKKNRYLKELLKLISQRRVFNEAVIIISFIPNHPILKKFIADNFLEFSGQVNISTAAVYLARYKRGWHDRQYNYVLKSFQDEHKIEFIKTMRIGCPTKLDKILNLTNGIDQELILTEMKNMLKDRSKLQKRLGIRESEINKYAKCNTTSIDLAF